MDSAYTQAIIQILIGGGSALLVGLFLRGPFKFMVDRVLQDIKDNKESIKSCLERNKTDIEKVGRELSEHKLYAVDNYVKHGECEKARRERDKRREA